MAMVGPGTRRRGGSQLSDTSGHCAYLAGGGRSSPLAGSPLSVPGRRGGLCLGQARTTARARSLYRVCCTARTRKEATQLCLGTAVWLPHVWLPALALCTARSLRRVCCTARTRNEAAARNGGFLNESARRNGGLRHQYFADRPGPAYFADGPGRNTARRAGGTAVWLPHVRGEGAGGAAFGSLDPSFLLDSRMPSTRLVKPRLVLVQVQVQVEFSTCKNSTCTCTRLVKTPRSHPKPASGCQAGCGRRQAFS
jgi:hypothetical protein